MVYRAPWCIGRHGVVVISTAQRHSTEPEHSTWTQVLHSLKSCSRRVRDSRWWGSLTIVPAGNNAKSLSSANHTTKTICHYKTIHHNYYHYHLLSKFIQMGMFFSKSLLPLQNLRALKWLSNTSCVIFRFLLKFKYKR